MHKQDGSTPVKQLAPPAQRALEEARLRRLGRVAEVLDPERDGPLGKEPTRFGDWERKGIAYDF